MADLESCSRLKQRLVIKFLVVEHCKPSEIFRKMSYMYEEACVSQKMSTNGLNYSKQDRKMFLMETGQKDLCE